MNNNFDINKIRRKIKGEVFFFETTPSTNLEAKLLENVPSKSVFLAEEQTKGRGRLGRSWDSAKGSGIYMTIYLEPEIQSDDIAKLTLLAGLAVARVIKKSTIKWPNDIILKSKKVSGILCELVTKPDKNAVLVGIGINANNKEFSLDLKDKATSLFLETGKKQDRTKLVIDVVKEFFKLYDKFLKKGISVFMKEYRKKCSTLGKNVIVEENGTKTKAMAVDVTDAGELLILVNGEEKKISFGEVSVRGLLGYEM